MVAQHALAGKRMDYLPEGLQTGAQRALRQENLRFCNIANTLWLLEAWGPGGKGVEGFMAAHLDEYFMHKFAGICQNKDGFVQDVIATAKAGLSLWHDRRIAHLTSTDTLDLTTVRTEKRAIFVVPPDNRTSYFGQLANLFYDTLFAICYKNNGAQALPVFFLLDEFPFLGKIPHIDDCVNTLRKYRVSINIVVQSLSQLEKIYGREGANTLLDGLSTKIFLPGIDAKNTARYLEVAAGESTRYDTVYGFEDERAHTVQVPLISAAQARVLDDDHAVIVSRNRKPAKIKLLPHYRDEKLRKLSAKGPGVRPLGNAGNGIEFLDLAPYQERERRHAEALRRGFEAQLMEQGGLAAPAF
jgi:type IV secretory pathway TraG/TraD family ATPase VirD4